MRTWASLLLIFTAVQASAALEIRLDPPVPTLGDVIAVEVVGMDNPARLECRFREKTYPFYMVGPGRLRALIGLSAKSEAGLADIHIVLKRFLLPDEARTLSLKIKSRKFSHQRIRMPKKKTALTKKPGARQAIKRIRGALKKRSRRQAWEGRFLRPAKGRQSSAYGHTRTINNGQPWSWHKGIDIAAPSGASVLAPNAGRVALVGRFPVQGGTIIVDHGQGLLSVFLHLKSFDVEVGQRVQKGAGIAKVGGGGFSTGSHLHWGVYLHGTAVDPVPLLDRSL